MHSHHKPGKTETWLSVILLACLLLIATVVLLRQRTFNPAVLAASRAAQLQGPVSTTSLPLTPALSPSDGESEPRAANTALPTSSAPFPAPLPPELAPLSALENFNPDNLYDKIDGKAELYLAAGFVQMRSQRFALKTAPDDWVEWFEYDLGSLANAFSVFSTQRRSEGQPLALTPYAYATQNGLYFVAGSKYIEALGSTPNPALMEAIRTLARGSVAQAPGALARLPELEMFPPEGLVPASHTLQVADGFGFAQFTNVYSARYHLDGAEVTAFVCCAPDPPAARTLGQAYRAFLLANGGKPGAPPVGIEQRVDILDGTELFFAEGSRVAGLHAATNLNLAEQVGRRLRLHLAKTPPE